MNIKTTLPKGKQNKCIQIFLIAALLFCAGKTQASHMMGADMGYTCLGGGKYLITAKVYRDCRGISFANPDFGVYAGKNGGNGCGGYTLSISRTKIADISQICSTETQPCKPTNTYNTGEGVEEHTYEVIVDFNKTPLSNYVSNSNCCEVTFYIGQSARNGAITTGSAGQYFVTTCMINICNIKKTANKCNSSPQFSNQPIGFLCCNQRFDFNNGAIDTIDYDSFSYRLVPGLQGLPNTSITYASPFSYQYPMTPFCTPPNTIKCTPNPKPDVPRGFFMDTSSGDIIFTPTKCDEVGIVVIEMTEWRKDSATGTYLMIGKTRRDMQLIVKDDCGYNKAPKIEGPVSNKVCEGDKICFSIYGKDETFTPYQTIPDTVVMTWNGGIPGATFKIKNPKDREKEAEFCWQTKLGQASDVAYSFTVTANDQHCKPPVNSIRGFKVKVNPRAFSVRTYTILKCGRFAFSASIPSNFKGAAQYKWSFRDSNGNNEFYFSSKKTDTMTFYKGGKFIVVHTVNNSDNCPTIYRDTIIIPPPPKVVTATKDTFACFNTTMKLEAQVYNAKLPYKYYWTRPTTHTAGDTFQTLTIPKVDRDSTIQVRVTDADGCNFYDTATIYVKPLPGIPGIPDQRICTYETATFDALHNDTMDYLWNTGDTTRTITQHIAGLYSVTISDTIYHCIIRDTAQLFVNDTVTALAGSDGTICTGGTYTLIASHRNQALPATYNWTDLSTGNSIGPNTSYTRTLTNNNGNGNPAKFYPFELCTKITQGGHTCEDRDTMVVKVNTLPVIGWAKNPLDPKCWIYGDILLHPLVTSPQASLRKQGNFRIYGKLSQYGPLGLVDSLGPNYYKFATSKISNLDLQTKSIIETLTVWYKDTNGCVNAAVTTQKINGNPIIKLDTLTFCQDLGSTELDKFVIKPKVKFGTQQKWEMVSTDNGVDISSMISDPSGAGTAWRVDFGTPAEDKYAGTYTMKFSVTDNVTSCFSEDTTLMHIVTEPKVVIAPPTAVCINWDTVDLLQYIKVENKTPQIFSANDTVNYFTVLEKNGDRTDAATKKKMVAGYLFPPSYFGPGDFLIKFSSKSTGCLKEDSFNLTVNDTPDAVLLGPVTLCEGAVLDLSTRIDQTNTKPLGEKAQWVGPNVNNGFFNAVSKDSAILEGPYKLRFDYTNNKGCTDTEYYKITVRSKPTISITTSKPASGCENSPFGIQSTSKYNNGIQWSTINGSDGSFDNTASPNVTYTHGSGDKTAHTAWVKVRTLPLANEVCPQVADSMQIVLHPYPVIDFTSPVAQCAPFTADFTGIESSGIPAGQLKWRWDFGNGDTSDQQNPTGVSFPNQGKYTFNLRVTNTAGPCMTPLTKTDFVLAYPKPFASFTTDPPYKTTIALPKFKTFNNSTLDKSVFPGGTLNYHWDFGDPISDPNDTSTQAEPRWAYGKDTNTYTITLIARSDFGCLDTANQLVHVGPDIIVFIPDIFTPDGAGVARNNVFMISAQNYKTANIRIYNRWGEKMWETDDITQGWDGRANGAECQQGVYVYHVEITSFEDKVFKFDGTITLLR